MAPLLSGFSWLDHPQILRKTPREMIDVLAKQCRDESIKFQIQFKPSTTGSEGRLRAELNGAEYGDLVIDLALSSGAPGNRTIYLDPGNWLLRLERGADITIRNIDVTVATTVVFPDPAPAPSRKINPDVKTDGPNPINGQRPEPNIDEQPRRRISAETALGLGTVTPAVALVVSGAVLTAGGTNNYGKGLGALSDPTYLNSARELTMDGVALTSQGIATLGASLGVGVVAVTDFAGANERALIAETATGGALAIGGLIWSLVVTQSYESVEVAPMDLRDHFEDRYAKDLSAHAILGFGAGLATSAAVSLLVTKLRKRRGSARARHVARRRRF